MEEVMQGYWFERAGKAADVLQFGELPSLQPGVGEVRVRIACSSVNPTDVKRRSDGRELGRFARITPNNDGSGIIDAVGSGVDSRRVGQRVWLFAAQAGRPYGTAAQHCVVPTAYAIELASNASFETGACMGVPAVTAHRALFADGSPKGKTILITGGNGRVGRYAVQMAIQAGATVIATASTAAKVATLAQLGAHHIVNYQSADLTEQVLACTDGAGVDHMVDVAFGVNIARAPDLIKPNGTLASYGSDAQANPTFPFIKLMYKNILIRPFSIMGMPEAAKQAAFDAVTEHLKHGSLSHDIGSTLNFEQMVQAHESIEAGATGVVLVKIQNL